MNSPSAHLRRTNPLEQRLLERMNEALAAVEEAEYEAVPELFPTLFIVGVPRSGTTLLHQLVASYLDVGYVNNLIACFWRAPLHGIRLSRKLLPGTFHSNLRSTYGRTEGIQEPHDFDHFWASSLGYSDLAQQPPEHEESVDWERLRTILVNMAHAFGRPLAFRSFLLTWHLPRIKTILPRAVFVRVRRDPVHTATALLRLRRQRYGSAEVWASLRPREAEALAAEPYARQVAGQVYYLERALDEGLGQIEPRAVLDVDYEELCADPGRVLTQIGALLASHGATVGQTEVPPHSLGLRAQLEVDPDTCDVAAAVAEFYGPAVPRIGV